jgi:succinate dehydrogenase / fumarate reductase membrane anchor subunit
MRSPLARAVGFGSAKEGVERWWMERLSAVALVPLTLWFVASIIAHTGSDYATFIAWLRAPLANILMILLLIGAKFAALVTVRLGCCALASQESSPPCASRSTIERVGARAGAADDCRVGSK